MGQVRSRFGELSRCPSTEGPARLVVRVWNGFFRDSEKSPVPLCLLSLT